MVTVISILFHSTKNNSIAKEGPVLRELISHVQQCVFSCLSTTAAQGNFIGVFWKQLACKHVAGSLYAHVEKQVGQVPLFIPIGGIGVQQVEIPTPPLTARHL